MAASRRTWSTRQSANPVGICRSLQDPEREDATAPDMSDEEFDRLFDEALIRLDGWARRMLSDAGRAQARAVSLRRRARRLAVAS